MTHPDERPILFAGATAGITQAGRLLPDLLPTHLQLDGRPLPEVLAYLARFSDYVQFYTASNQPPSGTWGLAAHRHTLLLATIAARPLADYPADTPPPRHRTALRLVLELIRAAAADLNNWQYHYLHYEQQHRLLQTAGFAQALTDGLAALRPLLAEAASYEAALRAEHLLTEPQLLPADFVEVFGTGQRLLAERPADLSPAGPDAGPSWRGVAEVDNIGRALQQVLWRFRQAHSHLANQANATLLRELQLVNNHQPEVGLLVAFARLFRHAQALLNDIPRRHLDYYYQQELGVPLQPGNPDRVYLQFVPEASLPTVEQGPLPAVPAGTLLDGGQDDTGQHVLYRTLERATLSAWRVTTLLSLFVAGTPATAHQPARVRGAYTATLTESEPGAGLGPAIAPGWPLLGADPRQQPEYAPVMQPAEIGFAVAASVLRTGPGRRRVKLAVQVTAESFAEFERQLPAGEPLTALADAFCVQVTQAAGWLTLDPAAVTLALSCTRQRRHYVLTWILRLSPAAPGFVDYQPEIHGGNLATTLPVVRLLLNPETNHSDYGYSLFAALQPIGIGLKVKAWSVTDLMLRNQQGELSPGADFYPFGAPAPHGSYLELVSAELQGKNLTYLRLDLTWQNLPPLGFKTYYRNYDVTGYELRACDGSQPAGAIEAGIFCVTVAYAQSYRWRHTPEQPLFQRAAPCQPAVAGIALTTRLRLRPGILRAVSAEAGVVQLCLTNPPFGFGDLLYPASLAKVASENAEAMYKAYAPVIPIPFPIKVISPGPGVTATGEEVATTAAGRSASAAAGPPPRVADPAPPQLLALPNPPLAPQLRGLAVRYRAAQHLRLQGPATPAADMALLHVQPFTRYDPATAQSPRSLLPVLPRPGGTLYLGLDPTASGQFINLVLDLTVPAQPDVSLAKLHWAYLTATNEWQPVPQDPSLLGVLPGFANAVRVELALPARPPATASALPADLHWLRAELPGQATAYGQLQTLYPRLVLAERTGAAPYRLPLPAGTLTQLLDPLPGVEAVVQPLPSFGGRSPENQVGPAYYLRVSELLRHRNRALLPWDYDTLLLERFAGIFASKVLSASQLREPGQLVLVALPAPAPALGALDRRYFSEGELLAMQAALAMLAPPGVRLQVRNPSYEEVQVSCEVSYWLLPTEAPSGYDQQLQLELQGFLTPWTAQRGFGGLNLPELVAFIQRQPYVRQLTSLAVSLGGGAWHPVLTPGGPTPLASTTLVPSEPDSVLTSAPTHHLNSTLPAPAARPLASG